MLYSKLWRASLALFCLAILSACGAEDQTTHVIEQGNFQGETTTSEVPINNCGSDKPLETTQRIDHKFKHSVNIAKSSGSNANEATLENDVRNHYQVESLVDTASYPVVADVPADTLFIYEVEWTELWREGDLEIGEPDDSPEATYEFLETVTGGVVGFNPVDCP